MRPISRLVLVAVLGTPACEAPDDRILEPEALAPVEIAPGVFRLTWNEGPDVVREITPDGARIVYRSAAGGVAPSTDTRMLSIAVEGGAAREEAGLYRAAFLQQVGNLTFHEGRRMLSVWSLGIPESHSCLTCPPPPVAVGITYLLLAAEDGEPLPRLPAFDLTLPVWNSDAGPARHVVRVTPAEQQIRAFGVDPYRPAIAPGGFTTFFSDGEAVWRYDAVAGGPRDSLFPGAFVALSPDGSLLAVSTPLGLDSTTGQCAFGDCQQTTIMITTTGWYTTVYNIATLEVSLVSVPGLEPVFDSNGARILVRRLGNFYWIDLSSGAETLVEGTEGAFAPAVFPDGSGIAFSSNRFGNADVFFARQ